MNGTLLVLLSSLLLLTSNDSMVQKKGVQSIDYRVVASLNHDSSAYTQGLFIHDGVMYESTGQYGESSFRKVDINSGRVLEYVPFDSKYFIEGSCLLDGRLYILTWRESLCFVYDINSLKKIGELRNPYEGWGITTDGKDLIMSDGSSNLHFMDPLSFMEKKTVKVKLNGKEVTFINELEYINGKIWANVYLKDDILVIDPSTGVVEAVMNCNNLLPRNLRKPNTDVLNGIAYDEVNNYIYLTGKYWPKIYKIKTNFIK